jgi:hypothetical protein
MQLRPEAITFARHRMLTTDDTSTGKIDCLSEYCQNEIFVRPSISLGALFRITEYSLESWNSSKMGFLLLVVVCCCFASLTPHESHVDKLAAKFRSFWKARPGVSSSLRVAVGWNVCADVIVRAADLLRRRPSLGFGTGKLDSPVVESEAQLSSALRFWSSQGKAAERFVSNSTFFADRVDDALAVGRVALGG